MKYYLNYITMNRKLLVLILSVILSITHQIPHCDDFEQEKIEECESYTPEDGGTCKLIGNVCQNVYLDCSVYNSDETKCNNLIPYGKKYSKCHYESSSCTQVLKECSAFDGDKDNCGDIAEAGSTPASRKCRLIDNKCTELKGTCLELGQEDCLDTVRPLDAKVLTCSWDTESRECKDIKRYCDQYIGKNAEECTGLRIRDTSAVAANKKCIYDSSNNVCSENYDQCSRATSAEDCVKIYPLTSDYQILKGFQCVWGKTTDSPSTDICHKELKDYKWPSCSSVESADPEFVMTSDICKKLETPGECVFGSGTIKCTDKVIVKKCSDFVVTSLKDKCENITPDFTKKCILSNSECLEKKKSCNELSEANGVTSDICEAALTESNKKCSLKSDKSGCEEVDITQAQSNNGESEDNNSNGADNINSKLIFVFLCLLFL